MRVAGFALLGFLTGAMAGFLAALFLVILWHEVFAARTQGGDGLSGLATFMVVAPLLALAGGAIGAIRFGRRAGAGTSNIGPVILAFFLVLVTFLAVFIFVGF